MQLRYEFEGSAITFNEDRITLTGTIVKGRSRWLSAINRVFRRLGFVIVRVPRY